MASGLPHRPLLSQSVGVCFSYSGRYCAGLPPGHESDQHKEAQNNITHMHTHRMISAKDLKEPERLIVFTTGPSSIISPTKVRGVSPSPRGVRRFPAALPPGATLGLAPSRLREDDRMGGWVSVVPASAEGVTS